MMQFIVLGLVPGTQLQLTFSDVLSISAILGMSFVAMMEIRARFNK